MLINKEPLDNTLGGVVSLAGEDQFIVTTYSGAFYYDLKNNYMEKMAGNFLGASSSKRYFLTKKDGWVSLKDTLNGKVIELPFNNSQGRIDKYIFSNDETKLHFFYDPAPNVSLKTLDIQSGNISNFQLSEKMRRILDFFKHPTEETLYVWVANGDGLTKDLYSWNPSTRESKKIIYSNTSFGYSKYKISKDGKRLLLFSPENYYSFYDNNWEYTKPIQMLYLNGLGKTSLYSNKYHKLIMQEYKHLKIIDVDENLENIFLHLYGRRDPTKPNLGIYWLRF